MSWGPPLSGLVSNEEAHITGTCNPSRCAWCVHDREETEYDRTAELSLRLSAARPDDPKGDLCA